jgi:NADH:ubiquinone oxidoreductase subunit 6 (subunit J)
MFKDAVLIFIIFLTLLGGIFVAFSGSLVTSAFGLLISLIGVAGIYILLSADFIAVSLVMIYIGGVVILIMISFMLTRGFGEIGTANPHYKIIPGIIMSLGFIILNIYSILTSEISYSVSQYTPTTKLIGNSLLKEYVLPFELASFMIVLFIIGSAVMVRKEMIVRKKIDFIDERGEKDGE